MFTPPRLLLSIETLSADAEPARVDLCGFYSRNNGEAGAIMRPMWLKPEYRRIFSSNSDFRPRRSSNDTQTHSWARRGGATMEMAKASAARGHGHGDGG